MTYKNYDATAECLGDLRKHYSASRVILRSDGDPDPRLPILANRNKVDFRGEVRLFGIENGGAVIVRVLELFLAKTNSIFVEDRIELPSIEYQISVGRRRAQCAHVTD